MLDTTELQAVDFALGAVIASAFDDLAENGPANYVRFLQREIPAKIFRTEHADPKELIDKITADKKGEGDSKRPDLPVVGYFRKPGLTNGESVTVSGQRLRWNEQLLHAYKLGTMPVSLDYAMTFAAWDKPTLDKLCLAWYARMTRQKRVRFIVPAKIAGDILEVPAVINDPKQIMLSDASMMSSEQRLYAVTTGITVNTQALFGDAINPLTEFEVWGITREYIRVGAYV